MLGTIRSWNLFIWFCFAVVLIVIALNDFMFFRIENEYVLFLFLLYAVSYCFGVSGQNFVEAVWIACIIFAICFVLNQFNFIGGGDVKLLVPLILFAENNIFEFIWGTAVGGLILALAYIFCRKKVSDLRRKMFIIFSIWKKKKFRFLRFVLLSSYKIKASSVKFEVNNTDVLRQEVPYGVALSCGGFFVIFDVMFR